MAKLYLERINETRELYLKNPKKLKDLMNELNISISSVILVVNGEIAMEEMEVSNNDEIKILSVVSGG